MQSKQQCTTRAALTHSFRCNHAVFGPNCSTNLGLPLRFFRRMQTCDDVSFTFLRRHHIHIILLKRQPTVQQRGPVHSTCPEINVSRPQQHTLAAMSTRLRAHDRVHSHVPRPAKNRHLLQKRLAAFTAHAERGCRIVSLAKLSQAKR